MQIGNMNLIFVDVAAHRYQIYKTSIFFIVGYHTRYPRLQVIANKFARRALGRTPRKDVSREYVQEQYSMP